ncbi:MAG: hypothetical protein AB7F32_12265 [Victivallaceae bacterium]
MLNFCTTLAYIDAGTGSMLLQGAIAVICSIALFFRQIKFWVVKQFAGKK